MLWPNRMIVALISGELYPRFLSDSESSVSLTACDLRLFPRLSIRVRIEILRVGEMFCATTLFISLFLTSIPRCCFSCRNHTRSRGLPTTILVRKCSFLRSSPDWIVCGCFPWSSAGVIAGPQASFQQTFIHPHYPVAAITLGGACYSIDDCLGCRGTRTSEHPTASPEPNNPYRPPKHRGLVFLLPVPTSSHSVLLPCYHYQLCHAVCNLRYPRIVD